jgi:hypothetical protein
MNSIYSYRLIVLVGSFGLISPLLAQSSAVSTNPGSGPVSAGTRYDYGNPLSANSSATSGSGSGGAQGNQSLVADPTHSAGSGVTKSRESNSADPAHPGEKVAVVDLHALPTSGTDQKFQGTFLSLNVKSIREVKPLEEKSKDEAQKAQTNAATVSKDAGDEKEHKAAPKEKSPSLPNPAKASPATNR